MKTLVINNVRVFDGNALTELKTVVIEQGLISSKTTGEIELDGKGGTLLPGYIDSHIHLTGIQNLKDAAKYGVTTMLDMATRSVDVVDSLRNKPGLTDIRSCYLPACADGGPQIVRMAFPQSAIVSSVNDAERFVNEQIASGADYIKIVIEDPAVKGLAALAPEIVIALSKIAHSKGKKVFAHVTTPYSFNLGIEAEIDVLTHTPLVVPLPESMAQAMAQKGIIAAPTMVMMKKIIEINSQMHNARPFYYENVERTVQTLNKAGVQIIASTDANDEPGAAVKHGQSLHDEFELMVASGMTPLQVLQSATSLPAKLLGFSDRGVIEPGRRADLVLVDGDPTIDIKATRAIKNVWIAGINIA